MTAFFLALMVATHAATGTPSAVVDKGKVAALMQHAIGAGRAALSNASADPRVKPDDLHDAEAQFALILIDAGQCPDAVTFVKGHSGVMAPRIDRLISATRWNDRECATALARIMLDRWNDPGYSMEGRIGARYRAAAYLDAVGDAAAAKAMGGAESEMRQLQDYDFLWAARGDAIVAYPAGPARVKYLDYLAQRMLVEKYPMDGKRWQALLTDFALSGRCDLIQKVTKQGPESCVEPQKTADYIGGPRNDAGLQKLAETFSGPAQVMDDIPLDEKAIKVALEGHDLWWRMTRLLTLINRCKAELAGT